MIIFYAIGATSETKTKTGKGVIKNQNLFVLISGGVNNITGGFNWNVYTVFQSKQVVNKVEQRFSISFKEIIIGR